MRQRLGTTPETWSTLFLWQPDSGYYAYYGGRPKPFDTKFEVVPRQRSGSGKAAVSAAIAAIRDAADAYFNAVRSLMELLSDLPVALEVDIPDTLARTRRL